MLDRSPGRLPPRPLIPLTTVGFVSSERRPWLGYGPRHEHRRAPRDRDALGRLQLRNPFRDAAFVVRTFREIGQAFADAKVVPKSYLRRRGEVVKCPCGADVEVRRGVIVSCAGEGCRRHYLRLGDEIRVVREPETYPPDDEP